MQKNSVTGFPRIGADRELKKALESYWSGKAPYSHVEATAKELRNRHWTLQKEAGIELIPCNDFSLYDIMLDTSVMLGAIPERFRSIADPVERYFAMARGDADRTAMEMTKWFNTNYHYIVPELDDATPFALDASKAEAEFAEARAVGLTPKINLVGPVTYLKLAKRTDGGEPLDLLPKILPLYEELLAKIAGWEGGQIVQLDEPALVTGADEATLAVLKEVYTRLPKVSEKLKLAVVTYFEHSAEATKILAEAPVWALGLDLVYGEENLGSLAKIAASGKTLIAGVVDGRNIWRNDLDATLLLLENVAKTVDREKMVVSSSCSLLHVPYGLEREDALDPEVKSWLSFAGEKLEEIRLLGKRFAGEALDGEEAAAWEANRQAAAARRNSGKTENPAIRRRTLHAMARWRETPYEERIKVQREALGYPDLATTTIGSFPQTPELRQLRRDYKNGEIGQEAYEKGIKAYIDDCVAFQEEIGLDVPVHGEPERNDMVEYFGQQMEGFAFTRFGWVQSYGSRCVKPPIIYGDIARPQPMTVGWTAYAQSRTQKAMKGMLTGPVTILNWSFVRDDLPRKAVAEQIAAAIADEVADLQEAGIKIIQVDEAAFKEGYPLRKGKIPVYEAWAVACFRAAVSPARKETQIHTHMCYSDFTTMIQTIEAMDADVISIETARAGNKLLKVFRDVGYKQEVGPGVYDIHSPRVPGVEEMAAQIRALLEVLPKEQLWINPDCGLKTRKWEEVKPSLKNMVDAVALVRKEREGN